MTAHDVTAVSGAKAQLNSATAVTTSAATSNRLSAAGGGTVGRAFVSQLRVKLGMIRPPTKEISKNSVTSPSRSPSCAVSAIPSASRCTSRLPISRSDSAPSIGRFRQLRPTMISRATTARNAAGNDRSASAATGVPITAESRTATRPIAQRRTSVASGPPCKGRRPVQFGIAVSKNPATVAAAKPKIISCACQIDGGSWVGRVSPSV